MSRAEAAGVAPVCNWSGLVPTFTRCLWWRHGRAVLLWASSVGQLVTAPATTATATAALLGFTAGACTAYC